MSEEKVYECMICGKAITAEEYEMYDGLCQECYETEIVEMDLEDD